MILVRYFILALLIYLLFYLLSSLFRKSKKNQVTSSAESVADILVEDPICHKLVPKKEALRAKIGGEVLYFCSEKCCEQYEKQHEEKV